MSWYKNLAIQVINHEDDKRMSLKCQLGESTHIVRCLLNQASSKRHSNTVQFRTNRVSNTSLTASRLSWRHYPIIRFTPRTPAINLPRTRYLLPDTSLFPLYYLLSHSSAQNLYKEKLHNSQRPQLSLDSGLKGLKLYTHSNRANNHL